MSGTVSNWEEERTPLTILSMNQKVFSTVKVLTHDSIASPLARKKAHFIRIFALRSACTGRIRIFASVICVASPIARCVRTVKSKQSQDERLLTSIELLGG